MKLERYSLTPQGGKLIEKIRPNEKVSGQPKPPHPLMKLVSGHPKPPYTWHQTSMIE